MGENKIHVPNHQPEWFLDLVFPMKMAHLRLTAIHTDLPVFPRLSPPHAMIQGRWGGESSSTTVPIVDRYVMYMDI
jgi:hypothetical protein